MPETSLPGTSCPGLPLASHQFAPTVLGESVLSSGDGLALAEAGEMLKAFAKGHLEPGMLAT
jgi:hypothetical protein